VPFLRVKTDQRQQVLCHQRPLFPNASHINLEIFILFKIVERSNKRIFGVDTTFNGPGASIESYAPRGIYGLFGRGCHLNFE
jgi:hypothetical protein